MSLVCVFLRQSFFIVDLRFCIFFLSLNVVCWRFSFLHFRIINLGFSRLDVLFFFQHFCVKSVFFVLFSEFPSACFSVICLFYAVVCAFFVFFNVFFCALCELLVFFRIVCWGSRVLTIFFLSFDAFFSFSSLSKTELTGGLARAGAARKR